MARMVNLEGKQVPDTQIPEGSLFIRGCWYSSADKLPAGLKKTYAPIFKANERVLDGRKKHVAAKKEAEAKRKQKAVVPAIVPAMGEENTAENESGSSEKPAVKTKSGQPCVNC